MPTSSLTSTDAPGHSHIVAIITLQPFVMVARLHGAAVLVKLRSAHLAAPTSVWNCAQPWRANQRLPGALTHWWAASSHLKGGEREMSQATFSTVKMNSRASPKQSQPQKKGVLDWNIQTHNSLSRRFSAQVSAFSEEKKSKSWCIQFFFNSVLPLVPPRFCDFLVQTKHRGTPACKSSHCWPGSPECLDTVFVPSPLLAPDLTHHLKLEPAKFSLKELTCNCAF